jgi:hypothetical protein
MVQAVNNLRRIGKARSLAALRDYLDHGVGSEKVVVICRLLFVNPTGWKPPAFGRLIPTINEEAKKSFPLFPIALSNDVPLLVIEGYQIEGVGEIAIDCLKLCEGLALVKKDYPLKGHAEAAAGLVKTEMFRKLYKETDLPDMVKMIQNQAGASALNKK